jgi:hypothetical protein
VPAERIGADWLAVQRLDAVFLVRVQGVDAPTGHDHGDDPRRLWPGVERTEPATVACDDDAGLIAVFSPTATIGVFPMDGSDGR